MHKSEATVTQATVMSQIDRDPGDRSIDISPVALVPSATVGTG